MTFIDQCMKCAEIGGRRNGHEIGGRRNGHEIGGRRNGGLRATNHHNHHVSLYAILWIELHMQTVLGSLCLST